MPTPGRVEAAQEYLRYADCVKRPPPMFDGMKPDAADLSPKEQAVEDAALEVLRRYFACEADFGDDPPTRPEAAPAGAVRAPAPAGV